MRKERTTSIKSRFFIVVFFIFYNAFDIRSCDTKIPDLKIFKNNIRSRLKTIILPIRIISNVYRGGTADSVRVFSLSCSTLEWTNRSWVC
jgi:hypothetical protein